MIRYIFALLLVGSLAQMKAQSLFHEELDSLLNPALKPFYFSVASGDPHSSSVVLWTKVWREAPETTAVEWQVATDTLMQNVVQSGTVITDSNSAYTVKVQVFLLQPATTYFYRFKADGVYSPIGRTKTAPVMEVDHLRFAVVSCSNYEGGYFNAYRLIAQRNDLDAVIHLGDYIYEYSRGTYGDKKAMRRHIPQSEILTLQDYRSRYAQYRLDSDLQEMHRLFPMIAIWDDHEFANNTYKDGAGNHQPDEGEWEVRKANGKKAYFEWLPIADNPQQEIERSINYGELAELFMLDGRIAGRSKQVDHKDVTLFSSDRTMLGASQEQWLTSGVAASTARWKIIANQVIFSELDFHRLSKKYARVTDIWDGYPAERKRIMDFFYTNNLKNIVVITGDIHTSWAFDLVQDPQNKAKYKRKKGLGVIGAEFVTPSITSANLADRAPKGLAKMVGSLVKNSDNPHLVYTDMIHHGYMLLNLTSEKATATWVFTPTVRKRTDKHFSPRGWSTLWGNNHLFREKKKNND